MDLIKRAQGLILKPQDEWAKIKDEPNFRDVLIMMLSSSGFRGDSSRCRELGLAAYLTKPVNPSQILMACKKFLEGKELPGVAALTDK